MDLRSNILRCLLFMSKFISLVESDTTQINFPHFSADDFMSAFGDVEYNRNNLSLILNANSVATSTGTCALLMYGKTDVRIQDTAAVTVFPFSTSFTVKFTTPTRQLVWNLTERNGTSLGTSFAFVVVDSRLGLVAMQTTQSWVSKPGPCKFSPNPYGPFFVVVFGTHTYEKDGEPGNDYIALRYGENITTRTESKTKFSVNLCSNKTDCSYLSNGETFTAWIDLTPEQKLQVWLINGSHPQAQKPLKPLIEYPNFTLPVGMGENVSLFFRGSSCKDRIRAHEILSWSFNTSTTPKVIPSSRHAKKWIKPASGVGGMVATLLILGFLSLCLARHRPWRAVNNCLGQSVFSYKELCIATKNFSENEKLGSGGFGTVYRGLLERYDNTLVAVKRINYDSKQAETTFLAEISCLSKIQHRSVVQLQGWCHEKGRLLLVYDYMPNGSLNEWLHETGSTSESKAAIPWKLRHTILEDIATAIEYLHTDCPQCILHRDIKSSNVMLDANFKAYLGDFGLARLLDHQKQYRTTMAAGTLGYMAPEMPYTGKATKESDVYSFGILVLEVVCGRQPLDMKAVEPEDLVLLYSVWRAHEARTLFNMADPRLFQTIQPPRWEPLLDEPICRMEGPPSPSNSPNFKNSNISITVVEDDVEVMKMMIKNLLHLGLLCCLPNPKTRPTMGQVIRILEQIGHIDNVDYVTTNVSMPSLPNTKPLGLYYSMEFSQIENSI